MMNTISGIGTFALIITGIFGLVMLTAPDITTRTSISFIDSGSNTTVINKVIAALK